MPEEIMTKMWLEQKRTRKKKEAIQYDMHQQDSTQTRR
jgi:hypothetical protein